MNEKRIKIVSTVITFSIIIGVFLFVFFYQPKATITLNNEELIVKTFFVNEKVNILNIEEAALIGDISASKVSGMDTRLMHTGKFENDKYGTFVLCRHNKVENLIVVKHENKYLIFNLNTTLKTEDFYQQLSSKLGE